MQEYLDLKTSWLNLYIPIPKTFCDMTLPILEAKKNIKFIIQLKFIGHTHMSSDFTDKGMLFIKQSNQRKFC